jgi:DNA-binding transcriptional ArsR family regulator
MKAQVRYNMEFDFLSFISLCANVKDYRRIFSAEIKQNPALNNKDVKKKTLESYKDAESFYNDAFTYMQRNELDMFFKKVSIFEDYLTKLAFKGIDLDTQTLDDFKKFVYKSLEISDADLTVEKLKSKLRDHYDNPNAFDDYNKETELILETLKDKRMFDSIFKNAIRSLRTTFHDKMYVPMKETLEAKIAEHNKAMESDPVEYILNLTSGMVKREELESRELAPYITFCTIYKLMFNVEEGRALIVYHYKLEKKCCVDSDKENIQSLLKFLSDPKRYQMVQMLSQKQWYANELAKEFKITPATMSYHVNKMFSLGLISFEQGDQNKMFMQLDKKRLDYLLNQVVRDLIQD